MTRYGLGSTTHAQATRQLANRWAGILHTGLERCTPDREHVAWSERAQVLRRVAWLLEQWDA